MSDLKHETNLPESETKCPEPGSRLAIPFLMVLCVLTVVAFIIPLRPTVSEAEKRELTKFPAFSAETLLSGEYFDEITLWFSDTFPGRETWLTISDYTKQLHGYAEVSEVDSNFVDQLLDPENTGEKRPEAPDVTEAPVATPTPEGWGGIDAGEEEVHMGGIIQIGDSAFNRSGFSKTASERYSKSLSKLGDKLEEKGARLISAPAPIALGIMVEPQYLKKLNSTDPKIIIDYMHDAMSDSVVTVDTVSALQAHNDEYLFFRTDHHWTALGAYYAYEAVCKELGKEPAKLEDFEVLDQGAFHGSHYSKVKYVNKLREDTCIAYIPPGDITTIIHHDWGKEEGKVIHDKRKSKKRNKYLGFLGNDYPLMELTNNSLPEDAGICLIIKDSYGNCFAPYFTQNYHKVYVLDYRKYTVRNIRKFVDKYHVNDVFFSPYMIATQSHGGNDMFDWLCS